MKCAVLAKPKTLEIIDKPPPELTPNEVLLDIIVCGVCRTDRKCFSLGQRDLVMPRVLGHEIIGRAASVGEYVTGVNTGDIVHVHPGVFCGKCAYCKDGNDHLCDQMRIIGFHLDGGFSEQTLVSGKLLNKAPAGIDALNASLAEPLACSFNIQKRMEINKAETMVIFGAGPLGILSAQLARHLGAKQIAIVEPADSRRRIAERFCDFVTGFGTDTEKQILDWAKGRTVDAVLPCCPGNDPFTLGVRLLSKRGRMGFFSGLTDTAPVPNAALNNIHYGELSVIGSYGCSLSDCKYALELLGAGICGIKGAPYKEISWEGLPETLSNTDPQENIFTFFKPFSVNNIKTNQKELGAVS